jgi:hypothetical protein
MQSVFQAIEDPNCWVYYETRGSQNIWINLSERMKFQFSDFVRLSFFSFFHFFIFFFLTIFIPGQYLSTT